MCFFEHYEAFLPRAVRQPHRSHFGVAGAARPTVRRRYQCALTHGRQLDITDTNDSDAGESRLLRKVT
jgi:hypothetical protein